MNTLCLPRNIETNFGKDIAPATRVLRFTDFLRQHLNDFRKYLELRKARRIDRLAFQNLLHVSNRILEDIGITRDDVIWASKLPLSKNAALELKKISQANRAAEHRRSTMKYWL